MKRAINPQESNRAEAFSLWMMSPQPMVTLTKTFDVSKLRKVSKKTGIKFNMLMCWCICKAARSIDEFYELPEADHLYRYDQLGVNVIVQNVKGGLTLCDVVFSEDLMQFNKDYLEATQLAATTCQTITREDAMIIGTSALPYTELDGIINQYAGRWNNPFVAWGKYRKGLLKTTLPISFQFHHAQMDGMQACCFLNNLQHEIKNINVKQ